MSGFKGLFLVERNKCSFCKMQISGHWTVKEDSVLLDMKGGSERDPQNVHVEVEKKAIPDPEDC